VAHYLKVLERQPWDSKAAAGLGNVLFLQGRYDEAVVHLGRAVRLNKEDMIACYNLGKVLVATGHPNEGIEHLKEALKLAPAYLPATKDLAWFLATHPDAGIRDPNEAMKLAERAVAMTGSRDAGALDTLAAAYALAGKYKKAVETDQKAFEMANRIRNYELANDIQERLRLLQQQPRRRQDQLPHPDPRDCDHARQCRCLCRDHSVCAKAVAAAASCSKATRRFAHQADLEGCRIPASRRVICCKLDVRPVL
jgi:tetratricopeptide (TPR) repeat protein